MERILDNSETAPQASDDISDYDSDVLALIKDAVDYEESFLQLYREENQGFYDGIYPTLDGKHPRDYTGDPGVEDDDISNQSAFVSTDARDTVLTVLPSLIRIFMSSEDVGEFIPTTEAAVPMASNAKEYIKHIVMKDNPGFLIIQAVIMDALVKAAGFTEWWTDISHEVEEKQYPAMTREQLQMLIAERPDGCEVVSGNYDEQGNVVGLHLRWVKSKPIHYLEAVPPEEFRISRDAKDIYSADLVGRERIISLSDVLKRGHNYEDVKDALGESNKNVSFSEEQILRNPALVDNYRTNKKLLRYGCWYVRIDKDGDGIDELRYICTVGDDYRIISDTVVTHPNLAIWSVQPIPHTALGEALVDLVKDIQTLKSYMIRGMNNNLAETVNPKMVINELLTNIDDALNDEVGGVIRTRGDVNASVSFYKTPYVGADIQPSIDYLDSVRASRTGITEASKGLDPKAMQSTSLTGIDAIIAGAQERIEMIARNLAETGWKDTMMGLLREVCDNPNPAREIRINDKWKKINPSTFDPNMSIEINPTLGKGSDMVRMQALSLIDQKQTLIMTKFGLQNNVVTPEEYLNTQEDLLRLANIRDFSRYFKRPSPEEIQAMQQAPKEPDPATVLAQAELQKINTKVLEMRQEGDRDQAQLELDIAKFREDSDFKRDELNVHAAIEVAKVMAKGSEEPKEADVSSMNRPPNE